MLEPPHVLRFAHFQLDVESGELCRDGRRRRLSPQLCRVLTILVSRPGRVVSREELKTLLWTEGTFVDFEHSIASAVNKLRIALGDTADQPRTIETLPGRGYRFVGLPAPGSRPAAASVAVLPVANLSGSAELDSFCDATTDALITELARNPDLRVPSRQSVLRYRGASKALGAIARELQVRTLLESAVARGGQGLRLSTRLLHVRPETHVWAAHHALAGPPEPRDEPAREIARTVHDHLA